MRFFIALVVFGVASSSLAADGWRVPVAYVYDTDTIYVRADTVIRVSLEDGVESEINVGKGRVGVRVGFIDAPEIRTRCASEKARAKAGKAHLEQLVDTAGGVVTLYGVRLGKFAGRVVAERVQVGDVSDLGEHLVARGHARRYDGRSKRAAWCDASE